MLDRIVERSEGRSIVCLKNVSANDFFVRGGPQGEAVMPWTLLVEAMAQASGLIMQREGRSSAYLSGLKGVRFLRAAVPGDALIISASLAGEFPPLCLFEAAVHVRDELISEAEIALIFM